MPVIEMSKKDLCALVGKNLSTKEISEFLNFAKATLESEKVVTVKDKKKSKEFESINMDALPESLKNLASSLVNQISK